MEIMHGKSIFVINSTLSSVVNERTLYLLTFTCNIAPTDYVEYTETKQQLKVVMTF